MIDRTVVSYASIALFLSAAIFSSIVHAAPTAEFSEMMRVSVEHGFGKPPALVSKVSGPPASVVIEKRVLPSLCHIASCDGLHVVNTPTDIIGSSSRISLRAAKIGDTGTFRVLPVLDSVHLHPHMSWISNDRASAIALELVTQKLATVFPLGSGETIVPIQIAQTVQTATERKTNKSSSSVVGTEVLLTRAIDGVPVLGPGSKIHVSIAPDESVTRYTYDWPVYQLGQIPYEAESLDRIRSRFAKRLESNVKMMSGLASWVLPSTVNFNEFERRAMQPTLLFAGISLDAWICGYYDPGSVVQQQGTLSLVCMADVTSFNEKTKSMSNHRVFVPASRDATLNAEFVKMVEGEASESGPM